MNKKSRLYRAYVVPIAAYLAVSIAGGYGTGREVVQYFSASGVLGGLLGLALAGTFLAVITATSFELARLNKLYDYQSFVRSLIGRSWVAFEILYILLFLLVLAVVGSAAGTIFSDLLGLPENVGMLAMLAVIGTLLFFGRRVVERTLVFVTFLLLAVFLYYFYSVWSIDNQEILSRLNVGQSPGFSWIVPAVQFATYSAIVAVIVLFSTRGIETRREALASGATCGLLVMVPGVLFHISFVGHIDEIQAVEVPIYWMIDKTRAPYLMPIYLVTMFATFLGTGLGFLQAVNERLDSWSISYRRKPLSRWGHVVVAMVGLLLSGVLGQFGVISLIADGYGTIAWGFLIVFVIPVLTIGIRRIVMDSSEQAAPAGDQKTGAIE